ncbi:AAA family ATPase [Peristeroidobacter soli]|jgi:magnesium chelatase subunit I|uniref:AAA family ATPase n=1 Tax=Peristeroidobacter soli TaxID=2497877 RepID=UPI00101DDBAC|nr:AAA family ATPase [Peristeroidobacter soli]
MKNMNVLPWSSIVGQTQLKNALMMSYIEPRISGVLVSGERGAGKSTIVRAFARMVSGTLPVTLPINATEDRVVGGWDVGELLKSVPRWKPGLLEEANGRMLYVDEVNLLDDHIVNIILDVTASGLLRVERESQTRESRVRFTLVGTMNPEEGTLRPQLLDRFGLMVDVRGLGDTGQRRAVLDTVMRSAAGIDDGALAKDEAMRVELEDAKERAAAMSVPEPVLEGCVALAQRFQADGHRGDVTLALASRALAALQNSNRVTRDHLCSVAALVLQHRRKMPGQRELLPWSTEDDASVAETLSDVRA